LGADNRGRADNLRFLESDIADSEKHIYALEAEANDAER